MEYLLSFLVVIGIIGFFYFRNKDNTKRNISIALAVISFLLFGLFVDTDEVVTEEYNSTNYTTDDSIENVDTFEESSTNERETSETTSSETEEETESKEVPLALEKFDHEIIESVDTYIDSTGVTWSPDQHTEHFLMDVADIVRTKYEELDNGALFISQNEFVDSYGNEETLNAIVLYLSPDTIEKINFDNESWGSSPQDMYGIADAIWIHQEFQTEDFTGVSGAENESVPQIYFNLISQ